MRSTEFLKEAPARYDDSGQEIGPAAGTVGAAQADVARMAQGEKNLNAVKGLFGVAPTELKDAPPGTSIDPIQRSRMGYKPATQQEIAAFQAANPNYGKVVGRDGQPIKNGSGGTWDAGGEKAVVQTAQAAAPQSKGDAHAGAASYNTDLERIPGAAQAGQQGYNYQPPAEPAAKLPTRPGQQTSGPTAKAAPGVRPAIVGYASSMGLYKDGKPDPAAIKAFQQKNGLTPDGIIGPNTSGAILSAAKPGAAGSGRGQQGVVATPGAAGGGRGKQGVAPAGIQQAATPAVPRRDSNTQRQMLAKTMPGPGGPAPVAQAATPAAPAAPLKPGLGNSPMRGGQPAQAATPTTAAGAAAAARAKMGLPNRPVTPPTDAQMAKLQEGTGKQSSFEYSVDHMRRLSTMLKG